MVGRAYEHRPIVQPEVLVTDEVKETKEQRFLYGQSFALSEEDGDGGARCQGSRLNALVGALDSLPRRPRCRALIFVLTRASAVIEGMTVFEWSRRAKGVTPAEAGSPVCEHRARVFTQTLRRALKWGAGFRWC